MRTELDESRTRGRSTRFVRHYTVRVAPRSWLGRAVAAASAATLVFLAFFFVSFFIAVGAVVLALAVGIGLLKSATGGGAASSQRVEPESATVIDAERSSEDGVYRARD